MKALNKFIFWGLVTLLLLSNWNGASAQNDREHYQIGIMKNLFVDVNTNDASVACKLWFNEIVKKRKGDFSLDVKVLDQVDDIKKAAMADNLVVLAMNIPLLSI